MNVGQILETHLGWAALQLGKQIDDMLDRHYNPDQSARSPEEAVHHRTSASVHSKRWIPKICACSPASCGAGVHMATPVFDGAKEEEIKGALTMANQSLDGQSTLFDGKGGQSFDHDVTVGVMYIMKLHHLVDDKIHARSIGRTPWLPTAARWQGPSSVVSASARWKSGPWKPTARPTRCRSS